MRATTVEAVSKYIEKNMNGIIAIDGELGAGKSTFTNEIAENLSVSVIHVDDFILERSGCYVEALNIDKLKQVINELGLPIIIEGVCLLDVLNKLHLTPSYHFFLFRDAKTSYAANSLLVKEVRHYIQRTSAPKIATQRLFMNGTETNQLDVDIAYLKAKTVTSVVLSFGGIVALIAGAYVITSGINSQDSAVFKFLGAEVSAEGIGSVILSSSVLWAYFAYLAMPKYSRRKEVRNETAADGSQTTLEIESTTMLATKPSKKNTS